MILRLHECMCIEMKTVLSWYYWYCYLQEVPCRGNPPKALAVSDHLAAIWHATFCHEGEVIGYGPADVTFLSAANGCRAVSRVGSKNLKSSCIFFAAIQNRFVTSNPPHGTKSLFTSIRFPFHTLSAASPTFTRLPSRKLDALWCFVWES